MGYQRRQGKSIQPILGLNIYFQSSCDATKGGLGPVGQIMLIVVFLVLLSLGTFAWQKYRRSQIKPEDAGKPKSPN